MLDRILRQAHAFERRHGVRPNVVYINAHHYRELERQYPDLFSKDPMIKWGMRIVVLPDSHVCHPEVVWVPGASSGNCQTEAFVSKPGANQYVAESAAPRPRKQG